MVCSSRHCDAVQCESGEKEEWVDSAVAGDREEGDGGNEIGERGSEIWPLE